MKCWFRIVVYKYNIDVPSANYNRMGLREKVALVLVAVILQTTRAECKPRSLKSNPFQAYVNNVRNEKCTANNVFTKHSSYGRNSNNGQEVFTNPLSVYKTFNFPEVEFPSDPSYKDPFASNSGSVYPKEVFSAKNCDISLINSLKKEAKRKRKSKKQINNDAVVNYVFSEAKSSQPLHVGEVRTFPEVEYPLSAMETWTPKYWNSLSHNMEDLYIKPVENVRKSKLNPKQKNTSINSFSSKENKGLFAKVIEPKDDANNEAVVPTAIIAEMKVVKSAATSKSNVQMEMNTGSKNSTIVNLPEGRQMRQKPKKPMNITALQRKLKNNRKILSKPYKSRSRPKPTNETTYLNHNNSLVIVEQTSNTLNGSLCDCTTNVTCETGDDITDYNTTFDDINGNTSISFLKKELLSTSQLNSSELSPQTGFTYNNECPNEVVCELPSIDIILNNNITHEPVIEASKVFDKQTLSEVKTNNIHTEYFETSVNPEQTNTLQNSTQCENSYDSKSLTSSFASISEDMETFEYPNEIELIEPILTQSIPNSVGSFDISDIYTDSSDANIPTFTPHMVLDSANIMNSTFLSIIDAQMSYLSTNGDEPHTAILFIEPVDTNSSLFSISADKMYTYPQANMIVSHPIIAPNETKASNELVIHGFHTTSQDGIKSNNNKIANQLEDVLQILLTNLSPSELHDLVENILAQIVPKPNEYIKLDSEISDFLKINISLSDHVTGVPLNYDEMNSISTPDSKLLTVENHIAETIEPVNQLIDIIYNEDDGKLPTDFFIPNYPIHNDLADQDLISVNNYSDILELKKLENAQNIFTKSYNHPNSISSKELTETIHTESLPLETYTIRKSEKSNSAIDNPVNKLLPIKIISDLTTLHDLVERILAQVGSLPEHYTSDDIETKIKSFTGSLPPHYDKVNSTIPNTLTDKLSANIPDQEPVHVSLSPESYRKSSTNGTLPHQISSKNDFTDSTKEIKQYITFTDIPYEKILLQVENENEAQEKSTDQCYPLFTLDQFSTNAQPNFKLSNNNTSMPTTTHTEILNGMMIQNTSKVIKGAKLSNGTLIQIHSVIPNNDTLSHIQESYNLTDNIALNNILPPDFTFNDEFTNNISQSDIPRNDTLSPMPDNHIEPNPSDEVEIFKFQNSIDSNKPDTQVFNNYNKIEENSLELLEKSKNDTLKNNVPVPMPVYDTVLNTSSRYTMPSNGKLIIFNNITNKSTLNETYCAYSSKEIFGTGWTKDRCPNIPVNMNDTESLITNAFDSAIPNTDTLLVKFNKTLEKAHNNKPLEQVDSELFTKKMDIKLYDTDVPVIFDINKLPDNLNMTKALTNSYVLTKHNVTQPLSSNTDNVLEELDNTTIPDVKKLNTLDTTTSTYKLDPKTVANTDQLPNLKKPQILFETENQLKALDDIDPISILSNKTVLMSVPTSTNVLPEISNIDSSSDKHICNLPKYPLPTIIDTEKFKTMVEANELSDALDKDIIPDKSYTKKKLNTDMLSNLANPNVLSEGLYTDMLTEMLDNCNLSELPNLYPYDRPYMTDTNPYPYDRLYMTDTKEVPVMPTNLEAEKALITLDNDTISDSINTIIMNNILLEPRDSDVVSDILNADELQEKIDINTALDMSDLLKQPYSQALSSIIDTEKLPNMFEAHELSKVLDKKTLTHTDKKSKSFGTFNTYALTELPESDLLQDESDNDFFIGPSANTYKLQEWPETIELSEVLGKYTLLEKLSDISETGMVSVIPGTDALREMSEPRPKIYQKSYNYTDIPDIYMPERLTPHVFSTDKRLNMLEADELSKMLDKYTLANTDKLSNISIFYNTDVFSRAEETLPEKYSLHALPDMIKTEQLPATLTSDELSDVLVKSTLLDSPGTDKLSEISENDAISNTKVLTVISDTDNIYMSPNMSNTGILLEMSVGYNLPEQKYSQKLSTTTEVEKLLTMPEADNISDPRSNLPDTDIAPQTIYTDMTTSTKTSAYEMPETHLLLDMSHNNMLLLDTTDSYKLPAQPDPINAKNVTIIQKGDKLSEILDKGTLSNLLNIDVLSDIMSANEEVSEIPGPSKQLDFSDNKLLLDMPKTYILSEHSYAYDMATTKKSLSVEDDELSNLVDKDKLTADIPTTHKPSDTSDTNVYDMLSKLSEQNLLEDINDKLFSSKTDKYKMPEWAYPNKFSDVTKNSPIIIGGGEQLEVLDTPETDTSSYIPNTDIIILDKLRTEMLSNILESNAIPDKPSTDVVLSLSDTLLDKSYSHMLSLMADNVNLTPKHDSYELSKVLDEDILLDLPNPEKLTDTFDIDELPEISEINLLPNISDADLFSDEINIYKLPITGILSDTPVYYNLPKQSYFHTLSMLKNINQLPKVLNTGNVSSDLPDNNILSDVTDTDMMLDTYTTDTMSKIPETNTIPDMPNTDEPSNNEEPSSSNVLSMINAEQLPSLGDTDMLLEVLEKNVIPNLHHTDKLSNTSDIISLLDLLNTDIYPGTSDANKIPERIYTYALINMVNTDQLPIIRDELSEILDKITILDTSDTEKLPDIPDDDIIMDTPSTEAFEVINHIELLTNKPETGMLSDVTDVLYSQALSTMINTDQLLKVFDQDELLELPDNEKLSDIPDTDMKLDVRSTDAIAEISETNAIPDLSNTPVVQYMSDTHNFLDMLHPHDLSSTPEKLPTILETGKLSKVLENNTVSDFQHTDQLSDTLDSNAVSEIPEPGSLLDFSNIDELPAVLHKTKLLDLPDTNQEAEMPDTDMIIDTTSTTALPKITDTNVLPNSLETETDQVSEMLDKITLLDTFDTDKLPDILNADIILDTPITETFEAINHINLSTNNPETGLLSDGTDVLYSQAQSTMTNTDQFLKVFDQDALLDLPDNDKSSDISDTDMKLGMRSTDAIAEISEAKAIPDMSNTQVVLDVSDAHNFLDLSHPYDLSSTPEKLPTILETGKLSKVLENNTVSDLQHTDQLSDTLDSNAVSEIPEPGSLLDFSNIDELPAVLHKTKLLDLPDTNQEAEMPDTDMIIDTTSTTALPKITDTNVLPNSLETETDQVSEMLNKITLLDTFHTDKLPDILNADIILDTPITETFEAINHTNLSTNNPETGLLSDGTDVLYSQAQSTMTNTDQLLKVFDQDALLDLPDNDKSSDISDTDMKLGMRSTDAIAEISEAKAIPDMSNTQVVLDVSDAHNFLDLSHPYDLSSTPEKLPTILETGKLSKVLENNTVSDLQHTDQLSDTLDSNAVSEIPEPGSLLDFSNIDELPAVLHKTKLLDLPDTKQEVELPDTDMIIDTTSTTALPKITDTNLLPNSLETETDQVSEMLDKITLLDTFDTDKLPDILNADIILDTPITETFEAINHTNLSTNNPETGLLSDGTDVLYSQAQSTMTNTDQLLKVFDQDALLDLPDNDKSSDISVTDMKLDMRSTDAIAEFSETNAIPDMSNTQVVLDMSDAQNFLDLLHPYDLSSTPEKLPTILETDKLSKVLKNNTISDLQNTDQLCDTPDSNVVSEIPEPGSFLDYPDIDELSAVLDKTKLLDIPDTNQAAEIPDTDVIIETPSTEALLEIANTIILPNSLETENLLAVPINNSPEQSYYDALSIMIETDNLFKILDEATLPESPDTDKLPE